MKEIGGYIEFEHYSGRQFHAKAIKLNCSRNALAYLIRLHRIKRIFIPYFLCDSVLGVCKKNGVEVIYYHIDRTFRPVVPDADFSEDWLYVVNYYGQITNAEIEEFSRTVPNLIVDNVQAFFQEPVCHIPTIYNCRKFFGVADGAYLYSDSQLAETIDQDISYGRMEFILGRFEKTANEFYPKYVANNEMFEAEPIKRMSALTENIMRSLDYERIKNTRTENFVYLHERLGSLNRLRPEIRDGAFAYPLLLENGAEIRKALQSEKIYVPSLWPDVLDLCERGDIEYEFAQNILPLPVDQRYGTEEMEYIVRMVSALLK